MSATTDTNAHLHVQENTDMNAPEQVTYTHEQVMALLRTAMADAAAPAPRRTDVVNIPVTMGGMAVADAPAPSTSTRHTSTATPEALAHLRDTYAPGAAVTDASGVVIVPATVEVSPANGLMDIAYGEVAATPAPKVYGVPTDTGLMYGPSYSPVVGAPQIAELPAPGSAAVTVPTPAGKSGRRKPSTDAEVDAAVLSYLRVNAPRRGLMVTELQTNLPAYNKQAVRKSVVRMIADGRVVCTNPSRTRYIRYRAA